MSATTTSALHVACLCAAWCRLCDDYAPTFRRVTADLQLRHPDLQAHWIDIEDEAELLGELDIETFPTIVVVHGEHVPFAGPLAPQPETLQRVLGSVLEAAPAAAPHTAEWLAFALRLRARQPA
ncbi:MAG: thioredoxin family protein [Rubrivivax sp.]|nr:thioredoxin family protein [Rubrivivax sp.]